MAKFLESERGGRKLVYNGFAYVKHNQAKKDISWQCEKKVSKKCGAYVKTRIDFCDGCEVKEFLTHSHVADPSKVELISAKNSLKRKATDSVASTTNIVSEVIGSTSKSVARKLPLEGSLKRSVQRYRSTNFAPTPKTVGELIISERFRETLDGDKFLLVEEPIGIDGRVVVFCTAKNLEILKHCHFWLVDGTFSVAPSIFTQLFTVHGFVGVESIPLVYALLTDKKEESYRRVFGSIYQRFEGTGDNRILVAAPDVVVSDFEKATMNAISGTFMEGETMIHGCYFHLCQSLFRRVQKAGLAKLYRTNADFKLYFKMIAALSFVRPHCVVNYYLQLETLLRTQSESEAATSILPILHYFGKNYVGVSEDGTKMTPKFEPKIWNNVQMMVDDGPRTNNCIEGWHERFQSMISCDHPSVSKLLDAIQKEQRRTERYYDMICTGRGKAQTTESEDTNNRLKCVISLFATLPFDDYLKGIANIFN